MIVYNKFSDGLMREKRLKVCLISGIIAFSIGLSIGLLLALVYFRDSSTDLKAIKSVFYNNSYSNQDYVQVSFLDEPPTGLVDGIFWSRSVEDELPEGFGWKHHESWTNYIRKASALKLQTGCGRMQNRLVVFRDGVKGCVRYRQNTDQIQGELFSFYLAQILKLRNLAPSAVSVVDLKSPLWRNLRNDIAAAQWNSNKPLVITQFIPGLESAAIPNVFRPVERHLNRLDVTNVSRSGLIELAQWSDLVIFDYLTANLDRIVNNLYNYQWNANIMDAPAHNLARKSDLLVFLDNESGLLHGYRLLKKYEVYHSLLLENLCVFRRSTVEIIKQLHNNGNIGTILHDMFNRYNSDTIKDILPTLPDKSIKILNERIDKVFSQITKCQTRFGT